ncbi:MAG: CBM9 family sugar-binding protein [Oscillospiraceae bacterium]|nr:CBM9 family sugar-binding protein [Oscillospiraceae bacterium]
MKMKKILAPVLFIAMIFALTIPAMAAADVVPVTANKSAAIAIDGARDDAYAGPVDIAAPRLNATDGFENAPGAATGKLWTAWDDSSVYFYIEVYDTTPNQKDTANNDCVEIFLDWNAGQGGPDEASADTPFWQIRVFAGPDADGVTDLGGYILTDAADWSGNSVFNDVCTHFSGPLNGNYNNGYVVEIKIPHPDVAALTEGKKIPFDAQICDNMLGQGGREGQMFIGHAGDGIDDNEKWHTPSYLSGLMTLGAAYVAPAPTEAAPVADAAAPAPDVAAPAPAAHAVTSAVQTGDNTLAIAGIMVLAAAGAVIFRRKLFVK